jgi:hypothetical protein
MNTTNEANLRRLAFESQPSFKRAPWVPPEVENAIVKVAGQYPLKTHVNIYSETDRLHIHVTVQYRVPIRWVIEDYDYPIGYLEGRLQQMRGPTVLFEWDTTIKTLIKRALAPVERYQP